jgi:hypothetical protein
MQHSDQVVPEGISQVKGVFEQLEENSQRSRLGFISSARQRLTAESSP